MKKLIFMLAVLVLLIGCAQQIETQKENQEDNQTAVEDGTETPTETQEPETQEPEAENKTTTETGVSQEDLDNLKADLEDLEAEDLGGLTE